eukprot:6213658-Pleurochrysis_carterae.AAC.3
MQAKSCQATHASIQESRDQVHGLLKWPSKGCVLALGRMQGCLGPYLVARDVDVRRVNERIEADHAQPFHLGAATARSIHKANVGVRREWSIGAS